MHKVYCVVKRTLRYRLNCDQETPKQNLSIMGCNYYYQLGLTVNENNKSTNYSTSHKNSKIVVGAILHLDLGEDVPIPFTPPPFLTREIGFCKPSTVPHPPHLKNPGCTLDSRYTLYSRICGVTSKCSVSLSRFKSGTISHNPTDQQKIHWQLDGKMLPQSRDLCTLAFFDSMLLLKHNMFNQLLI